MKFSYVVLFVFADLLASDEILLLFQKAFDFVLLNQNDENLIEDI